MFSGDTVRWKAFYLSLRHPYSNVRRGADMLEILILEDYPPLYRALEILLQQAGYQVARVQTAGKALRALSHHAYDLLVMDMDVRHVDFRRLIEELQALPCHLPVVALISPQSHWAHNGTGIGIQIVLHKPIDRQALLRGIEMGLKNHLNKV